jgi:hypothetical protein
VCRFINAQTGKCLMIAGGGSTDNDVPALQSTATRCVAHLEDPPG